MRIAPTFHFADFLAITSGVSALASWQEQLDWGLRVLATLIAIAAGLVALYQRLRKRADSAQE